MVKVRLITKKRSTTPNVSAGRSGMRYAGGGSSSDRASEADHAKEADHAANADNATLAAEATHAVNADHASKADEAKHAANADHATNADEAKHAASASDIDSDSSVWTTIKNWLQELRDNCLKWFLRKDIEDTATKHITFAGGLSSDDIHSEEYNDSLDQLNGKGYHLWLNGNTSNMVLDNLSVRDKWTATILDVMKLQYSAGNITIDGAGGEIFAVEPFGKDGESLIPTDNLITTASTGNLLSDEGKVLKEDKKEVPYSDSDVFFYRCYFKATDGEKNIMNMWHVGDQARCQTFNLSDGTHLNAQNKTYFRVVINKSDVTVLVDGTPCFYIDLSNVQNGTLTGDDGKEYNYRGLLHSKADDDTVTWLANDAPEKGDQVAHVGNVYDEERQGAVQLVAVGAEKGLFIYDGINETLENLNDFLRVKWSPKNSLLNTTFLTYTNGYHTNNPYIYCGDWSNGTTAHPNEVWQYNGGSWICNTTTTSEPADGNTAWSPFAQKGEKGDKGDSVKKTGESIDYQISNSGTTVPTGTWSKTIPTATADKPYLWTRSTIKFNSGDDVVSYSVSRQGTNGQNGKSLKVSSTTKYYKGTNKPASDSGYTLTDFPSVGQGDIVWSLTTTTYTDPDSNKVVDTTKSYGCSRIGYDGDNGAGIHIAYSTTYPLTSASQFSKTYKEGIQYIGTYSSTETNDGEWNDKRWVWQKIKGEQGPQGRPGNDGTSVTITSTSVSYQISDSATTIPMGTWSNDILKATDSKPYLWTKTVVVYSDGKSTTSYSVSYKGKDGSTPSVSISTDGYWVINGTKTNDKAIGDDGHNPYVGDDGYWYTWNEKQGKFVSTGIKVKGDKGDSINVKSAETSYQLSDDGTKPPTGTWITGSVPQTSLEKPFLWTKVVVTFTDDKQAVSYSVARQGVAVSIVSTSTVYATTTDNSQPTEWPYTSIPTVRRGTYLWSKTTVVYSDTSYTETIAVSRIGADGEKGDSLHIAYSTELPVTKDSFSKDYKDGVKYVGIYSDSELNNLISTPSLLLADGGQILYFSDVATGEWNDPHYHWQKLVGDDGAPAESYYVNPSALIITERLNTENDNTNKEKKYQDKDFIYDIPSNFSIHHAIGDKDSIIKIADDGWKCLEGAAMLPSKWTSILQNSFMRGSGYDISTILTKSSLSSHSEILKVVLEAKINNSVSLNIEVYINRLGTTQMETYGDTTTIVRKKVLADVENGYVNKNTYKNDTVATSEKFGNYYTKTEINNQTGEIKENISTVEQTAENIKLSVASKKNYRNLLQGTDFKGTKANYQLSNDGNVVEISSEEKYDETNTLHIKTSTSHYSGIYFRPVMIKHNTAYHVSILAKGSGTLSVEFIYQTSPAKDANSRANERPNGASRKELTSDWKLYEWDFSTNDKYDSIELNFWSTSQNADIYLARPMLEEGTEYTGWTLSADDPNIEDKLVETGIDIESGKIEAKTGKFDFVGLDGNPYIRVEQDSEGMPHLIFYNKAGTAMYDLGYTGLFDLIQGSDKQSWVKYIGWAIDGNTIKCSTLVGGYNLVNGVVTEPIQREGTEFFEYHSASFVDNSGDRKYYHGDLNYKLYKSDAVNSSNNNAPTGNMVFANKLIDGYLIEYQGKNGNIHTFWAHSSTYDSINDDNNSYKNYKTKIEIEKSFSYNTGMTDVITSYRWRLDGGAWTQSDAITID